MHPGATLGPYPIDREIGSGGMGRVLAASVVGETPGMAPGLTLGATVAGVPKVVSAIPGAGSPSSERVWIAAPGTNANSPLSERKNPGTL